MDELYQRLIKIFSTAFQKEREDLIASAEVCREYLIEALKEARPSEKKKKALAEKIDSLVASLEHPPITSLGEVAALIKKMDENDFNDLELKNKLNEKLNTDFGTNFTTLQYHLVESFDRYKQNIQIFKNDLVDVVTTRIREALIGYFTHSATRLTLYHKKIDLTSKLKRLKDAGVPDNFISTLTATNFQNEIEEQRPKKNIADIVNEENEAKNIAIKLIADWIKEINFSFVITLLPPVLKNELSSQPPIDERLFLIFLLNYLIDELRMEEKQVFWGKIVATSKKNSNDFYQVAYSTFDVSGSILSDLIRNLSLLNGDIINQPNGSISYIEEIQNILKDYLKKYPKYLESYRPDFGDVMSDKEKIKGQLSDSLKKYENLNFDSLRGLFTTRNHEQQEREKEEQNRLQLEIPRKAGEMILERKRERQEQLLTAQPAVQSIVQPKSRPWWKTGLVVLAGVAIGIATIGICAAVSYGGAPYLTPIVAKLGLSAMTAVGITGAAVVTAKITLAVGIAINCVAGVGGGLFAWAAMKVKDVISRCRKPAAPAVVASEVAPAAAPAVVVPTEVPAQNSTVTIFKGFGVSPETSEALSENEVKVEEIEKEHQKKIDKAIKELEIILYSDSVGKSSKEASTWKSLKVAILERYSTLENNIFPISENYPSHIKTQIESKFNKVKDLLNDPIFIEKQKKLEIEKELAAQKARNTEEQSSDDRNSRGGDQLGFVNYMKT